jgi:hypothetical protein
MLSWIPLLGPIIQGLMTTGSSIYMKYKDTELGKLQTNRTNDLEEAKVAAQIIRDTNDDITLRIIRDAALVFPVLWGALIGWDTIVAKNYRWLMFGVENYPESVQYIPYMAYVFLFGVIGMNVWKRK